MKCLCHQACSLATLPAQKLVHLRYATVYSLSLPWRQGNLIFAGPLLEGRGESQRLPVWLMLSFGGLAGVAAQTMTYPLDVVRRQMQVREICS